ncbi:MAG: cytochrome c3 family protein [Candidatus Methanoperedens sp.]|nr:cytochrome c3 family protein [Candidatus Methanoperedens sp.]MCZ7370796.1 cytochrome c3 family protein [Candidatus Methanoperedens sp.]
MSSTWHSFGFEMKNKYVCILAAAFFLLVPVVSAQQDVSCYHCHTQVVSEFRNNIHYQMGFTCANCHGGNAQSNVSVVSVEAMSGNFIGRPSRENITNVCSKCHIKEANDYMQSIHWEQIKKGHTEAATCTDCHGIHEIRAISDPNSSSNHQNSPATCAKCHSNKEMMSAWYYGIKTDRLDTYKESFHWKALSNGYNVVATCADCHNNHLTKSTTDPTSSTYPENLPKTCGKANCHPGAILDVKIAAGLVHDKESLHTGELSFNKTGMDPQMDSYFLGPFDLAYWIALFFKILTTGVIGIFAGMVLLDFFSRFKIQKRW